MDSNEQFITFFRGMVNKEILSIAYDLDGRVVIATNLQAKLCGYQDYRDLIGKTLFKLLPKTKFQKIVLKLDSIRQEIISTEKMISYVNFFPYQNNLAMLLCYHQPVFSATGEIIGSMMLAKQSSIFKHTLKINQLFRQSNKFNTNLDSIQIPQNLTKREEEILYLLTIGLDQKTIAKYLGVTRGTISKTIACKICSKFGMTGTSSLRLIEKTIQSGYFKHIPKSLLIPKVIVIDNNFDLIPT